MNFLKNLFVITVLLLAHSIVSAQEIQPSCSLKDSMIPKCYNKHDNPVLKVALIYYGDHMTIEDVNRVEPILIERFKTATKGALEVKVVVKKVFTYKQRMPKDYTFKKITDKKRLQRIWYYDNVGSRVMKEVYDEFKIRSNDSEMDSLDAILAITGAQFDGLGFASGRVSVTEYPREIAWNLPDGGRVAYPSDYLLVDELIHELGHNMFLGHTSTQCQKAGMTVEQRVECCALSASKDDVLSYCRDRRKVSETFMNSFESCNLEMINDLVVPAILSGGTWSVAGRRTCQ